MCMCIYIYTHLYTQTYKAGLLSALFFQAADLYWHFPHSQSQTFGFHSLPIYFIVFTPTLVIPADKKPYEDGLKTPKEFHVFPGIDCRMYISRTFWISSPLTQ